MNDLVPDGWTFSRFDSVCKISNGQVDPKDEKFGSMNHIGNANIEKFNGRLKNVRTAIEDGQISGKYLFDENDVLYGKINPHFAKVAFPKYKGLCSADIYPISSNSGEVVSEFLFQVLLSEEFTTYSTSVSGRTGMPKINRDDLNLYHFKLPPTTEQQKIAAILSSVDEVIEKTQAQINKLKDLKTGMMQELLSPRVGQAANIHITQGESKNGLLHTEFKDSPLGRIPVGWEVVKTGDISKSIVPGRNKPKSLSGDIPWLTIADLDSFYVDKSKKNLGVTYENLREANGKTIPAKSVIMSVVGEFGISSVARCEMVINQQLHGFVCNEDIDPAFLCLSLRHHKLQQERLATQTTIAYMNKDNAESILFAKPPFSQQLKIAASILAVDEKINVLNSKHSSYINTKKALMQDLLTGKVRVQVDAA